LDALNVQDYSLFFVATCKGYMQDHLSSIYHTFIMIMLLMICVTWKGDISPKVTCKCNNAKVQCYQGSYPLIY
jgi:hypothetical protein